MIKNTFILPGIVLLLGMMAAPAMAATIINGGGPAQDWGYAADLSSFPTTGNTINQTATEFTAASAAAITGANWWGLCGYATCTTDSTFTLTLYADNAGVIGAPTVLFTGTPTLNGSGTVSSGGNLDGTTEFSYSATFTSVALTTGTNYLLGISRTGGSVSDASDWFWETSGVANTLGVLTYDSSVPGWTAPAFDVINNENVAYNLTGTVSGGGGGNAPEPATFALMGLGLMGLGFAKRRRVA